MFTARAGIGTLGHLSRSAPRVYAKWPMMLAPLRTYLKMYRKRSGFSHGDVAFLLGAMSGSTVSRHERMRRLPMLRTALMYEFILNARVRELYEGLFWEAQSQVRERARGLCASLEKQPQSAERDRKIAILQQLLAATPDEVTRHAA